MLGMIAEALYYVVDELYEKLVELLLEHWNDASAGFNHGQLTIYGRHLDPAIAEWLEEAADVWPDADADEYVDHVHGAYDGEVTERAFSETILQPVDKMWEIIYQAQALYEFAQALEAADTVLGG